jgi:hypothetical protein
MQACSKGARVAPLLFQRVRFSPAMLRVQSVGPCIFARNAAKSAKAAMYCGAWCWQGRAASGILIVHRSLARPDPAQSPQRAQRQ